MNTRKSLESLTLELSEINEKQAHIINKAVHWKPWTALLNKGVEGRNNERFYH